MTMYNGTKNCGKFKKVDENITEKLFNKRTRKKHGFSSRRIETIFFNFFFLDILRNVIIAEGLDNLANMLSNSQTPLKLKKDLVKVIVNLCLGGNNFRRIFFP